MIYAYSDVAYPGCLKVGFTAVDVDKRVAQQYPTKRPDGKVDVNDVPDRPYFVNQPMQEDDEEEAADYSIPKSQPAPKAAEKPIVPKTPITPTYRPAFVPPTPAAPAPKPAEKPKVNVSNVEPGTVVIHKAFGEGTVKKVEPSKLDGRSVYVFVSFGKLEKQFPFPGAFYDGFLKVKI